MVNPVCLVCNMHLCHLSAVWLRTDDLTTLGFSFIFCIMRLIIAPSPWSGWWGLSELLCVKYSLTSVVGSYVRHPVSCHFVCLLSKYVGILWRSTLEVNRMWVVSTYNYIKSPGLSQERLRVRNGTPTVQRWGCSLWPPSLPCGQRYFRLWQRPLPLWTRKWCQGQRLPTWPFLVACV